MKKVLYSNDGANVLTTKLWLRRDSQLVIVSNMFSLVLQRPIVFMDVNIFDLLAAGMSTMSSIAAVFFAETCAVVSSSNRSGGRRLRMFTSLSRKALSSKSGIFLRHISKRRLQKRDLMWGGK
eukprot:14394267-Ditylum_brightwellii.AAC.2